VEPVVLPDMQHLSVDTKDEVTESCLFYPTGQKNKNMRRDLEVAVRGVFASEEISHHSPGGKHTRNLVDDATFEIRTGKSRSGSKGGKSKTKAKTLYKYVPNPEKTIPLFYKPPVGNKAEIGALISKMREREIQIVSTTTLRV